MSVYLRKGLTDLPDTVNFDAYVKDDTKVTLSSNTMSLSEGATIAIHCVGQEEDTTNFKVQLTLLENIMLKNSFEFLDLAASAAAPAFEKRDGMEDKDS